MTAYEILGVPETATDEEIRAAWRRAAAAAHPDHNGGDDARSKLLSRAWRLVNSPAARRAYDARLAQIRSPRVLRGAIDILTRAQDDLRAVEAVIGDPRVRRIADSARAVHDAASGIAELIEALRERRR